MSTETAYIDDGYTFDAKVPRQAGVHPEVSVSYRPATFDERNRYLKASADPERRASAAADLVVAHVKEWGIATVKGPVPVSKDAAKRVQPTLLDKIIDLILGYAGSAEDETDRKNS